MVSVDITLFTPVTEADIRYIAQHIRPEDAQECLASSGLKIYDFLNLFKMLSDMPGYPEWMLTGRATPNDNPCVIFGCGASGNLWMIGTSDIDEHWKTLIQQSRATIRCLHLQHEFLWTWCDERNKGHLHFLRKALGFHKIAEGHIGVNKNINFIKLVRARGDRLV